MADADGGVVDQNNQSAEVRLQFLDLAFHGGPVAYVGVERQRSSPCRCDGCAGGICARPVGVVVDTHVCSSGCKRNCDCSTDPLGSAGHEGNGTIQRHHPLVLLQSRSMLPRCSLQFCGRVRLVQSFLWSMRTFRCRNAGYKPALPVDTASVFPAVDAYFPLPTRRLQTCATGRHFSSLPCRRCAFAATATQVANLRYRSTFLQSSLTSMGACHCRHAGCKPALPVVTSPVFHAVDAHLPLPQRRLQTCATGQHFCSLP